MSAEFALQQDMFTDDLVDNRSAKQKEQARVRSQPKQIEMFSQREMAQFGVDAHPKLPLSPKTKLELVMEDPRTDEEKQRDLQRQVEQHTYPLPIERVRQTQEFDRPLNKNSRPQSENGMNLENATDDA
jgi:hypothetical protein